VSTQSSATRAERDGPAAAQPQSRNGTRIPRHPPYSLTGRLQNRRNGAMQLPQLQLRLPQMEMRKKKRMRVPPKVSLGGWRVVGLEACSLTAGKGGGWGSIGRSDTRTEAQRLGVPQSKEGSLHLLRLPGGPLPPCGRLLLSLLLWSPYRHPLFVDREEREETCRCPHLPYLRTVRKRRCSYRRIAVSAPTCCGCPRATRRRPRSGSGRLKR